MRRDISYPHVRPVGKSFAVFKVNIRTCLRSDYIARRAVIRYRYSRLRAFGIFRTHTETDIVRRRGADIRFRKRSHRERRSVIFSHDMRGSFSVVINLVAERENRSVRHSPAERSFHVAHSFESAVKLELIEFFEGKFVVINGVFARRSDIELQHRLSGVGIGGKRRGNKPVPARCTRNRCRVNPKIGVCGSVSVFLELSYAKAARSHVGIGTIIEGKKISLSALDLEFGAVYNSPYHAVARAVDNFKRRTLVSFLAFYGRKAYIRERFVLSVKSLPG